MNKYIVLEKTLPGYNKHLNICALIVLIFLLMGSYGCKHDNLAALSTGGHEYQQVNLVADTAGYGATRIDTDLNNPWGIAANPYGKLWIAVNHNGSCVVYDATGAQALPNIDIPLNGVSNASSPDGAIYNSTPDFIVNGHPTMYLFSTEDGIITTWSTGDTAVTVADRSAAGAIYKGLAIANDGTGNFIYAADFFNARIDVFDQAFNYVTNKAFSDPTIPVGFAPFNIKNIGGRLYVTYAKQKGPDNEDDQSGAGNGYIDVYNPNGALIKRFATQGPLNSPWGIAEAPQAFGQGASEILIANFGDGTINVFDTTGVYKGPLENNNTPIIIDGLWDIAFSSGSNTQLYFTAGPQSETYGLFGYLKVK